MLISCGCIVDTISLTPSLSSLNSSTVSTSLVTISRGMDDRLIRSISGTRCKVIVLIGSRSRMAWRQQHDPSAKGSLTSMVLVPNFPDKSLKLKTTKIDKYHKYSPSLNTPFVFFIFIWPLSLSVSQPSRGSREWQVYEKKSGERDSWFRHSLTATAGKDKLLICGSALHACVNFVTT